jgi:hypothetical protein
MYQLIEILSEEKKIWAQAPISIDALLCAMKIEAEVVDET